jgi:glycosyltransferase involved in cell wall biosynthesis
VATAVGGIPEMVTDRESALLVAPRDRDSLRSAIATGLTDRSLAEELRTNARQLVEDRHSPERRARTLCAMYGELLTGSA